MVAFLIIALFVATSLAVVVALADSAVRARNAWKTILRELAADYTYDLPANDAVVVQLRPAVVSANTSQSRDRITTMPDAFAA